MKKRPTMSEPVPLLTKLSSYQSMPKWTISTSQYVRPRPSCDALGPAAFNPTSCINKTSKFRQISYACSFGSSKRWGNETDKHRDERAVPGPGAYCPPADYSQSPYISVSNISFGTGGRMFPKFFAKQSEGLPAPSAYDIRGKHRLGGLTFDPRGVSVKNRHGWYYDTDVSSVKMNPGPGQYNPRYPNEHHEGKIGFGTGSRPEVYLSAMKSNPSPGRYDSRSELGGPCHSFATTKPGRARQVEDPGTFCAQPTQFG